MVNQDVQREAEVSRVARTDHQSLNVSNSHCIFFSLFEGSDTKLEIDFKTRVKVREIKKKG